MTIQQAIKKAIKGGYDVKNSLAYPKESKFTTTEQIIIGQNMIDKLLLDPDFWKCLHPTINLTRLDDEGHMTEPWKNLAMDFWKSIMDGKPAQEFFKEINI